METSKHDENDQVELLKGFNKAATMCEHLVSNWSNFNMSATYYRLLPQFETSYEEAIKGSGAAEGFSSQVPEEKAFLHVVGRTKSVKTVCETGFNYGHSSFNFLTSNPNSKVHSFDIGSHDYAPKMAKVLGTIFENRITVHFGDSRKEVPKAKADGTLPLCDLIFVDGGHIYDVARSDLLHFGSHANPNNLVIFDDHPTSWSSSFGRAWDEMLVTGENIPKTSPLIVENIKQFTDDLDNLARYIGIIEMVRCRKPLPDLERGFVVGRYVLRPPIK